MIVWLWDVSGPAQIAETCLRSGQANAAKVESAVLVSGLRTLTSGYQRTGEGWRGCCGDSGIRWEPLAPAPGAAAS